MTDNSKPNTMTYNWENVPRDLLEAAKAKAKITEPPPGNNLKWLLIRLVREYLNPAPKRGRPPTKTKR